MALPASTGQTFRGEEVRVRWSTITEAAWKSPVCPSAIHPEEDPCNVLYVGARSGGD
jgi:hypothetical protein